MLLLFYFSISQAIFDLDYICQGKCSIEAYKNESCLS